jgi:hypothetical protein
MPSHMMDHERAHTALSNDALEQIAAIINAAVAPLHAKIDELKALHAKPAEAAAPPIAP